MSQLASLVTSNHPTCLSLLQSCTSMIQLLQIHAQMIRNHFFQHPFAASKLVEFCALSHFGNLHYARKVFDQIPDPNTFTWNTIIRGYSTSPFPKPSLHLFNQMLKSNATPNTFTFPFVIKACSNLVACIEGEQVHGFILKCGIDKDLFSVNGLIHMYATCGKPELARLLLDTSRERDLVSWNSMLSGYVNCGLLRQARTLFDEMPEREVVTWNAMINGYIKFGEIGKARELFDRMPTRNIESWNILMGGYAKCGFLESSRKIFNEMPERNVVSWSSMITAYAQGDDPKEALVMFDEMKKHNIKPNWKAIVSALSACAHLGALDTGRQIHHYVDQSKMKIDSIIATALIDLYAKCGCVNNALKIFKTLPSKDVFTWTAMIGGLAVNGHGNKALELFSQMREIGVRPNEVTFVGVLCACSHGGFVELAKKYFDLMKTDYSIDPQIEHYTCMVDILGRAGRLEEAVAFLEAIPVKANSVLWGALLGACWMYRDAKIGKYIGDRLIELDPDDSGIYVLLSNIYAAVGQWEDVKSLRIMMKAKRLVKSPGRSSIEIDGTIHEFYVGDKSHPRTEEIYLMLNEINLRFIGIPPNTLSLSFDIEDQYLFH